MNKYMVIEHFKDGCWDKVYERLENEGRLLPEGLYYLNSWSNKKVQICYQLMETSSRKLFNVWFDKWNDLIDFELVKID